MLKKAYSFLVIYWIKRPNSMVPPPSMIFVGDGSFSEIGDEFKEYLIGFANLQPNNRILDVGCGIGRMAIPLTGYLSSEGEYWGFDIVKMGIVWCQRRITTKFRNFHFLHADIYNKHYNPHGRISARAFHFPFEDQFFDLVFLTSVFTHMVPLDIENYLREIARVLKTGGACLITFFVMNQESEGLIRSGRSTLNLKHGMEGYFTVDSDVPETAIGYDEEYIEQIFEKSGLTIVRPIHYGSWCSRAQFLSYQDIIIARKED